MRLLNRFQNRTAGLTKLRFPLAGRWRPPGKEHLQQVSDFFGAAGFGLGAHLGFAREINVRQFALHDELQIKRVMNSMQLIWQLLGRDNERMGAEGPRGNLRRPGNEPNRYSGEHGGKKRGQENRL